MLSNTETENSPSADSSKPRMNAPWSERWKEPLSSGLVFAFLLVTYSWWTWTPALNDLLGDSAYYVLMARYFSPLVPPTPELAFFAAQNAFPPLYPLLLAFTGGATNLLIAHQVTALTLVLALYVFYRWLQLEGVGRKIALVATVLAAIVPGLYNEALYLRSEPLFLLLSLCAFALFAREKGMMAPVTRIALTALCVAGALLTRSVGIGMLLAFAGLLMVRRVPQLWLGLAIAVLPSVLLRLMGMAGEQSYFSALAVRMQVTGADNFFSNTLPMAGILADGWESNLIGAGTNSAPAMAIGVACLAATLYRAAHLKFDALYILFTLLILLMWPFGSERVRFMMVLAPVMLGQLVIVAHGLRIPAVQLLGGRVVLPVVIVICLSTFASNLLLTALRSFEPRPSDSGLARTDPVWFNDTPLPQREALAKMQGRYLSAVSSLATNLPAGECVISVRPALVGLYANRLATIMPAVQGDGSILGSMPEPSCNYILMSPSIPTYPEPLFPYGAWHDRIDITHVFRLDDNDPQSIIIAMLGRLKSGLQ